MSRWIALGVALLFGPGCAEFMRRVDAGQAAPPPPRDAYEVTLVSAEVAPARPDGQPWDQVEVEGTPIRNALCAVLGVGVAAGAVSEGAVHASIGAGLGTRSACASLVGAREGGTVTPGAPDLVVEFRIGDRLVRSPVATNQFTANFESPFIVDPGERAAGPIRIHVADADGDEMETIATKVVGFDQLLSTEPIEIADPPALRRLVLFARRVDRQQLRREASVMVPASQQAVETDIVIRAGQRVTLRSSGEVCTSWFLHDRVCAGPEGSAEPALRQYNVAGFGDHNHLALLGLIGTSEFVPGVEKTFVAETTGNLVLVVNDRDLGNDSGEFIVRVVVE